MVAVVAVAEAGFFLAVYGAYGFPPLSDAIGAAFGLAAGLVGMTGYVLYYEAISRGTISRIGTITAAYPAITVALAVTFLGETMSPLQVLGVGLLVSSSLLLGYRETEGGRDTARLVTVLVLLAFLLWGVWGFLVKVAVTTLGEGGAFPFFALSNGSIGFALLLHYRWRKGSLRPLRTHWRWPALGTALGASGVILFTLALAEGPAALVTPLTGAYPVVTVLVAVALLQERVGLLETIGLATFLLGLFALAGV